MKCKRCGRENPSNASRCRYCNTPFYGNYSNINMPQNRKLSNNQKNKNRKKQKSDNAIIAAIVVLALIFTTILGVYAYQNYAPRNKGFGSGGGGGGIGVVSYTPDFDNEDKQAILDRIAELNEGNLPEITYDSEQIPSFIDGKYSALRVTDYRSAMLSLLDIKGLMQLSDPASEYIGLEKYTDDSHNFFKLQQVVNEISVYNKQLIIETDMAGNIECLSCDYDPNLENVSTIPSISQNEAETKALADAEGANANSCDLYIYTLNGEPMLSWIVEIEYDDNTESELVVISAEDGTITERILLGNEIAASGVDMRGDMREFDVSRENNQYQMIDANRGIIIYDCNETKDGNIVTSSDNTWNNASAVTAMSDIKDIVDFYRNNLHTRAFKNGKLTTINVFVNYKPKLLFKYDNAYSKTSQSDLSKTQIVYGTAKSYVKIFDVTAHELTHSVIAATIIGGLTYKNQSGAINEAYADIIGNLIQNELNNQTEWEIGEGLEGGAIRSMSNPNSHRQPEKIDGKYMGRYCYSNHNHSNSGCDNGGVHTNSGIINKAAYLMYQKGLNNKIELATLFCRSLNYMTSTTDFLNCRASLLRAAKDMGMSAEKISSIDTALREVGIYIRDDANIVNRDEDSSGILKGTLIGKVADANTGNAIAGVEIIAENESRNGIAHSDSDGSFSVKLKEGIYNLSISASGYLNCSIEGIEIKRLENTYLENTILLEEINGAPLSQAGGKVTNAVSGEAIEGVNIKFRKGWGKKTGAYVGNGANAILNISTNSNGQYYTSNLEYGYYTMEVSKDGYATQFINIIASNTTENSLNQNVVLVPAADGNDFRITLEWDDNPRDEDAHIVGDLPAEFHVYYRNKSANINGETIANLDHDDTQGNGFETVTLKADRAGTYKYYVYHYAGEGSLSASNAKVKVYQGNVMIKQYNVPVDQGNGRYWNVFNIENGEVVTINRISDSAEQ